MKKRNNNILFFLIVLLLVGCSSFSQSDAEQVSVDFIKQNVQFFAKGETNDTVTLPTYDFSDVSSYQENGMWVVVVHVVSQLNGTTKDNDLMVTVDSTGKVLGFNGRKLPG